MTIFHEPFPPSPPSSICKLMLCFFRDEINANCTEHAKYTGLLLKLRSETNLDVFEDVTVGFKLRIKVKPINKEFHSIKS